MLPSGSRSGKDTLDVFFVDLLWTWNIERERWMTSTRGKAVICTCRAIFLLGAREMSGSSMSLGGISGSFSMALFIASMVFSIEIRCSFDFARASLRAKESMACWRRHLSHL